MLWNPSTGQGYSSQDERCPLQDVSMLVGMSNMYANIQAHGKLSQLSFNLENAREWLPFYSPLYPHPAPGKLSSIQPASLRYTPTSKTFVLELEEQLQDTLKRYIRRWRAKRSTTSFNAEVRTTTLHATVELQAQGDQRDECSWSCPSAARYQRAFWSCCRPWKRSSRARWPFRQRTMKESYLRCSGNGKTTVCVGRRTFHPLVISSNGNLLWICSGTSSVCL